MYVIVYVINFKHIHLCHKQIFSCVCILAHAFSAASSFYLALKLQISLFLASHYAHCVK